MATRTVIGFLIGANVETTVVTFGHPYISVPRVLNRSYWAWEKARKLVNSGRVNFLADELGDCLFSPCPLDKTTIFQFAAADIPYKLLYCGKTGWQRPYMDGGKVKFSKLF